MRRRRFEVLVSERTATPQPPRRAIGQRRRKSGLAGSGTPPAAPSAETTGDKGPTGIDLPAVAVPETKFLAIDVSYGIEVGDISKGINDVIALSDRHGGQIYERTINITDDRSSTASFVIKLPPEQIETGHRRLGCDRHSDEQLRRARKTSPAKWSTSTPGWSPRRPVSTECASCWRIATDLGQILSLESQLTERETLVEQYTAMKRATRRSGFAGHLASAADTQP